MSSQTKSEVLVEIILSLQEQVNILTQRVSILEKQISKNSRNSSKPSSTDGLNKPKGKKKTKSLRKKTGNKQGGQGHKGHHLEKVANPDHIIPLTPISCPCGVDHLADVAVSGYDIRQVFELPEPKLEVFEYQNEIKICPKCGQPVNAPFPEGVNAPVQYGPKFRGMLVYMRNQHFLPANRLSQMVSDLYGTSVSTATILNASARSYPNLDPFEESLVSALTNSKVHADESGVRTVKKLYWLHSASTDLLTFYGVHEKRGILAMDDFNILPNFTGLLIHDFWKPYLKYDCDHGLCNAHHL